MDFKNFFPVWGKLTAAHQNLISGHLMSRTISKGTVIHNGSMDCTGLLLVKSGQLRAYITRMLRYFQNEGIVKLSRGVVEITGTEKLEELSDQ